MKQKMKRETVVALDMGWFALLAILSIIITDVNKTITGILIGLILPFLFLGVWAFFNLKGKESEIYGDHKLVYIRGWWPRWQLKCEMSEVVSMFSSVERVREENQRVTGEHGSTQQLLRQARRRYLWLYDASYAIMDRVGFETRTLAQVRMELKRMIDAVESEVNLAKEPVAGVALTGRRDIDVNTFRRMLDSAAEIAKKADRERHDRRKKAKSTHGTEASQQ